MLDNVFGSRSERKPPTTAGTAAADGVQIVSQKAGVSTFSLVERLKPD